MVIPAKRPIEWALGASPMRLFRCILGFLAILWVVSGPAEADGRNSLPFIVPPQAEINKIHSAVIYTSEGDILVELFPEIAPTHVANFKYRADRGFYRNSLFDIYYPGYIIQGGKAPKGSDSGPAYSLPPEFSAREHSPGILGMARASDEKNAKRESSGSQFHIILGESPHMDGNYTIFGRVKGGMAAVENLRAGSRIKDIKVFVRPES